MKRTFFIAALVGLPACVVDSPIAEQATNEDLGQRITEFCASTCSRLHDCLGADCECIDAPSGTGGSAGGAVDPTEPTDSSCTCSSPSADDCEMQCQAAMTEITGHDQACKDAGENFMSCLDAVASCNDDQIATCSDSDVLPPECLGGGSPEPTPGDNEPTPGGAVVCRSGSGGGTAGGAGTSGTADFLCVNSLADCSDGATYDLTCDGTEGKAICSCRKDGVLTHTFTVAPATCPATPVINAVCGWNLAELF